MKFSLTSLLIGGGVNVVIIWMLSQYSEKLALLYALMLLMALLLLYGRQIMQSFNLVGAVVRNGSKK